MGINQNFYFAAICSWQICSERAERSQKDKKPCHHLRLRLCAEMQIPSPALNRSVWVPKATSLYRHTAASELLGLRWWSHTWTALGTNTGVSAQRCIPARQLLPSRCAKNHLKKTRPSSSTHSPKSSEGWRPWKTKPGVSRHLHPANLLVRWK